jgi:hypothetical protein
MNQNVIIRRGHQTVGFWGFRATVAEKQEMGVSDSGVLSEKDITNLSSDTTFFFRLFRK